MDRTTRFLKLQLVDGATTAWAHSFVTTLASVLVASRQAGPSWPPLASVLAAATFWQQPVCAKLAWPQLAKPHAKPHNVLQLDTRGRS